MCRCRSSRIFASTTTNSNAPMIQTLHRLCSPQESVTLVPTHCVRGNTQSTLRSARACSRRHVVSLRVRVWIHFKCNNVYVVLVAIVPLTDVLCDQTQTSHNQSILQGFGFLSQSFSEPLSSLLHRLRYFALVRKMIMST
jgi:hypothetical protein